MVNEEGKDYPRVTRSFITVAANWEIPVWLFAVPRMTVGDWYNLYGNICAIPESIENDPLTDLYVRRLYIGIGRNINDLFSRWDNQT